MVSMRTLRATALAMSITATVVGGKALINSAEHCSEKVGISAYEVLRDVAKDIPAGFAFYGGALGLMCASAGYNPLRKE